jgi:hypothetical protein
MCKSSFWAEKKVEKCVQFFEISAAFRFPHYALFSQQNGIEKNYEGEKLFT